MVGRLEPATVHLCRCWRRVEPRGDVCWTRQSKQSPKRFLTSNNWEEKKTGRVRSPFHYSLGYLGCLYPKLQTCLNFKMPYNGIPEYFASLRYNWRKISYWGHIQETTKPRGGYRYCHGIPLFGKNTMSVLISKMPNNGIPLIYRQGTVHQPVYGTFNDNKTKRGIPIYRLLSRYTDLWQKIRWGFSCCLCFRGRIFVLV